MTALKIGQKRNEREHRRAEGDHAQEGVGPLADRQLVAIQEVIDRGEIQRCKRRAGERALDGRRWTSRPDVRARTVERVAERGGAGGARQLRDRDDEERLAGRHPGEGGNVATTCSGNRPPAISSRCGPREAPTAIAGSGSGDTANAPSAPSGSPAQLQRSTRRKLGTSTANTSTWLEGSSRRPLLNIWSTFVTGYGKDAGIV